MTDVNTDDFAQSLIGKSPYEIYKAIREFDNVNGKGAAKAALQQSQTFRSYCKEQLAAFLSNKMALPKRDAENIDKWWKFFADDFSLEDIQKANAKIANRQYIYSDKFIDMQKNKNFLLFAEHIDYFQEELEMPDIDGMEDVRISERQKLVDYLRFMESGKNSRQAIEDGNWDLLTKKFEHFPSMPSDFLLDVYEKNYSTAPNGDRTDMLLRILLYRINDINQDNWKLSLEEAIVWEKYLDEKDYFSGEIFAKLKAKIKEAQEKAQNTSPTIINYEEADNDNEKSNDSSAENKPAQTENIVQKEHAAEDKKAESQDKTSTKDNGIAKLDKTELPKEQLDKNKDKAPTTASWKEKALSDWQDWSKKNNKIVQEYKPQGYAVLAFKIYDNAEKAKADEFDADITYRKENDIVVKGHKDKVPSDDVFAAIVAQAKKNGPEICFGDIKSSVFKAKLMLACLNDPEVKMVNPPKLSELTDLPEDLKTKLEEKLPRRSTHAKERMNRLYEEKNGRPRPDKSPRSFSDKKDRKSSDRLRGTGNSDNNSGKRKSFRPRNGNTSMPIKRDNQYE